MAAPRQFTDLVVTAAIAGAGLAAFLAFGPSPVALVALLPTILLLPGYAIVSIAYPREPDVSLGTVGRFALAVALSAATLPAVAGVANFVTGVYPFPVVVGLVGVTLAATVLALIARVRVPENERFAVAPLSRGVTWYGRYLRGGRSLRATAPLEAERGRDVFVNLLVAVSVLILVASVGFAATTPQQTAFSEAYLATTAGDSVTMVDGGSLSATERESLVAVVQNHERTSKEYTVVVSAQTLGNGGEVREQHVVKRYDRTIGDEQRAQFAVPQTNGDRVVVDVYVGGQHDRTDPDYHLGLRGG